MFATRSLTSTTFFIGRFNGNIAQDEFEPRLLSRFDDNVIFILPEGHVVGGNGLKAMFEKSHSANKGFKIQIRDVAIRYQIGSTVLATYIEWQIGAANSELANNARVTRALLDMGLHVKWLHIHETWLPEEVRSAGPFDF